VPPEALRAVRQGMFNVVNGPAGSGGAARRADVMVAGKTGTAEAAFVKVPARDSQTGKLLRDEKNREVPVDLVMSTHDAPNPQAPWYRATGRQGDSPHHSWFIGFAPAENPQIAVAVLVEYGGSGGGAAGSVASKIIELCVAHDYLKVPAKNVPQIASATQAATADSPAEAIAAPLTPAPEVELLHSVPAAAATLPAAD
jgi:cell division protein FtsI/penicillin-binding protein 2